VHAGPAAPDATSGAVLSDTRDGTTGRLTQSTLQISASAAGAGCQLQVIRYGDGVTPIGVGSFTVTTASGAATDPSTVSPVAAPTVFTSQGSWQCAGACGALLQLSHLDADHVEGFFSGTLQSASGGSSADVVCSFYLPTRSFTP
jgi:hypothetical protein